MYDVSFWELVGSSPEWVGIFANALFAVVTIAVVITWPSSTRGYQAEHPFAREWGTVLGPFLRVACALSGMAGWSRILEA
jgi:hypothetical protein